MLVEVFPFCFFCIKSHHDLMALDASEMEPNERKRERDREREGVERASTLSPVGACWSGGHEQTTF
jgi:hypothetical protein